MKKLSLLMLLAIILAGCGNNSKVNALTLLLFPHPASIIANNINTSRMWK